MEHEASALPDVVILLAAAVIIVAVFRSLRLSPVLGFLFAGAAIGPYGLSLLRNVEQEAYLAEFGVVFLLFIIGLELSFKKLAEMRYYVLGIGGLQLVLTSLAIGGVVYALDHNIKTAIVIGCALALSSTAIVLQVLDEAGERFSQTGRVSFSVLLLQDLAVIPLLILVPVLAGDGGDFTSELGQAFIKAMIAVIGLIIVGRILLRPFLRVVAKTESDELFVATALLLALGASFTTEYFGLSMALGAFISGLLLAETEFQKQIEADILPFKGLLMGLFFMTVGMKFNVTELALKLPEVLMYSGGLILLKALILMAVCRMFKLSWQTSIKSGLLLAQGGEFAFILFNLSIGKGLIDGELGQILLLVVTFTMALTPLVFSVTNYISHRIDSKVEKNEIKETEDLGGHFVLIGYGWLGENIGKMLELGSFSYVAIDQEVSRVKYGRENGVPVYYGDAGRAEILESLHVEKAKAVIITVRDSRQILRLVQIIRNLYPASMIIVRSKHVDYADSLKKHGADIVIPEAYEGAVQVGKSALQVTGMPDADVERLVKKFRAMEFERDKMKIIT